MPLTHREKKSHHIDLVAQLAEERLGPRDSVEVVDFIRRFLANVEAEGLQSRPPEELYGAALSLWKFAANRPDGAARIRVYNPEPESHGWRSPHTIVEIVNDDMPFLVDSTTMALTGMGREIFLVIHPILTVERDEAGRFLRLVCDEGTGKAAQPTRGTEGGQVLRESVMHIEIDEQTDPDALAQIKERLQTVLNEVRAAVEDWQPMRGMLLETLAGLERNPPPVEREEVAEIAAFLKWLAEDQFTFLGYRHYEYKGEVGRQNMETIEGSGLGILRNPNVHVLRTRRGLGAISPEVRHFLQSPHPLIVTKTNVRSTVHRPVHMDYIGVKTFDEAGKVTGERRFVGLFTSNFYTHSPRDIPFLRRKVMRTLEHAQFSPASHDGKALLNVLETFPRDELFQIDDDRLIETSLGILRLEERPRVKVFLRPDKFERFVSALVYIPRDIYSTEVRKKIETVLAAAHEGEISTHYTQVTDAPLAREHIIVRTTPGKVPKVDAADIDQRVTEAIRTWEDRLRHALVERRGEEEGLRLWSYYGHAFSAAYREAFTPDHGVSDIEVFEHLKEAVTFSFHVYRLLEDPDDRIRIKFYHANRLVPLSECLPMFEHMGLKVLEEQAYELAFEDGRCAWILDFLCGDPGQAAFDLVDIKGRLEDTLWATCSGKIENDGFNALVLKAGLSWEQANIFRALGKYLRQTEITFSQEYMQETLAANPAIATCLAGLFAARFEVGFAGDRDAGARELVAAVEHALEAVSSLDQDRIVRRYLNLIATMVRTNYYQRDEDGGARPALAFKIDSQALEELPEPRPWMEIFVYAPSVEGVHLRGGKVARGGIRWSDRREDFRTEVLGLMKAQMVKNAVIVPVGAKGGFIPKHLQPTMSREEAYEEGVAAYRIFIGALLDLTDNLKEGAAVPPADVVRHDGDDPYLVVAADKGTASFSDTANEISKARGFWLGDAFASGGSAGYDHKKMAITARGAWVSVERHFREMGVDIREAPFSAIGIGDMSGDVFGNGMLLSRQIRLLGAFDHRHIFIDPDPDIETSFEERRRLFSLPRSSWDDYDKTLISEGGGVFSRQAKAVALTPQIKALTGLDKEKVTPSELIKALLLAEADLLWVGGIGTYVKAAHETHAQVGDRTNDALRVDARDLRVKVVGEGGNLGFTQRSRIEFAAKGGRINTDAVDNSAGVDCSDHEVNIKILLNGVVADGDMTEKQRDRLLVDMTEDVAQIVLADNYQQTQAISVIEAQSDRVLEYQKRLMRDLEKTGRLKRDIEYLPSDEELTELARENRGLTRPEIAVLIAYAKMALYDAILASDIPDDPVLETDLFRSLPAVLGENHGTAMRTHPLRREIIATELANEIVNYAGPTFLPRIEEETGFTQMEAVRAYVAAREVFGARARWQRIEALDNRIPAAIQYLMLIETTELLRRGAQWFLSFTAGHIDVGALVGSFAGGVEQICRAAESVLADFELEVFEEKRAMYSEQGVPGDLAADIAALDPLAAATDIVRVANERTLPVEDVGRTYFRLGSILGLDWLRSAAEEIPSAEYWDRLAINAIIDDLFVLQRQITGLALQGGEGKDVEGAVADWVRQQKEAVERIRRLMAEFRAAGDITVAKLGYASRYIRQLLSQ